VSRPLFEQTLGFSPVGNGSWEVRGESRGGLVAYDASPADRGFGGAGTVHHVAFGTQTGEQEAWQEVVARAGMHPTPVIDRFWFRSVYFREPNGVLFELATLGPGFSVDEDPAHLGEKLILPPAFEHLRDRIEPVLTPIENPRTAWVPTTRSL
jgi:glyoxalase family protein